MVRWNTLAPAAFPVFLFLCTSVLSGPIQDQGRTISDRDVKDPIELVQRVNSSSSLLDLFEIKELTGEEYLGDKYVPFKVPTVNIRKNTNDMNTTKPSTPKEEKTPPATFPPVEAISFEEHWQQVVNYHKNHTVVTQREISLRYNLVKEWREGQQRMRESDDNKYVVYWPPKAGLGNTISFLGNALLLSLYTNRTFLLYRWDIFPQFFSLPIDDYITNNKSILSLPDTVLAEGGGSCEVDWKSVLNGDNSSQYIVLRRSCGIDQMFVHDESLHEWLMQHGILGSKKKIHLNIYHRILQFLFVDMIQARPEIMSVVNEYKQMNDWYNSFVIGIHIRSGLLEGNVGWGRFLEKQDVKQFVKIAKKEGRTVTKRRHLKWFVLSDDEHIKEEVAEEAGDKFLTYNCTVIHSKSVDLEGWRCSVIQNYLLSECHFLVLTAKSTFGYLAKHRCEASQKNVFPKSYL